MNTMKTLGHRVIKFIESYCVHSTGDYLGKPFVLRDWQKEILLDMFEIREDGSFKYHTAYISTPKGNGKSEIASALAVAGLMGLNQTAPLIPLVASSYDQADIVFSSAKQMIQNGELRHYADLMERKIVLKDNPQAQILRVPCVAGVNDGMRPSMAIFDEVHEMTGNKERAHLVISNGLRKRENTMGINISTAGVENSLCFRLYKYAKGIEEGTIEDEGFYYKIFEADTDLDISDPEQRKQAIEQANPALGDFVSFEQLERAYHATPENEFRRYFLNQWTTTAERWLPVGVWEECYEEEASIEEGSEVILAFDGSYSRDSTALVAISMGEKPHIEVLGHWARPVNENQQWKVPRDEVINRILECFEKYQVLELTVDPMGWHNEIAQLEEIIGGDMVLYYEGNYRKKMAQACSRFYSAVLEQQLSHSGDNDLFQHLINCVPKETPQGTLVTKANRNSPHKIDLAIGAIMAFDRWSDMTLEPEEEVKEDPKFINL